MPLMSEGGATLRQRDRAGCKRLSCRTDHRLGTNRANHADGNEYVEQRAYRQ